MIEDLYDFVELIKWKSQWCIENTDDPNLLTQQQKPIDLFIDAEAGHVCDAKSGKFMRVAV